MANVKSHIVYGVCLEPVIQGKESGQVLSSFNTRSREKSHLQQHEAERISEVACDEVENPPLTKTCVQLGLGLNSTPSILPVRLTVGREFLALKIRVRFLYRQPTVPDRTLKQFPYNARIYQPSTSYCKNGRVQVIQRS